jgi:hypothetical protein
LATRIVSARSTDIILAKHIVNYLKHTRDLGLTFRSNVTAEMDIFVDAGRDLNDEECKGQTGICTRLGHNKSAMFYYISKKQSLVTRFINKSEIYAIDLCMYNVERLRRLLEFLHCPQQKPTTFYEDNESSIGMLTGTTKLNIKSKHIA